ncbi:MAG: LysM peptidoglycan-binding domain-containing protein [Chitinophagaceae bacterium]|nr:LysM peptidoglycan-binding domain-containing protein [Chitinophagaceae bacterium]
MNIRHTTLSLFLILSLNSFAQDPIWTLKKETKNSFLDSIKSTFVQDNIASCVDSLWMKELSNLDLYNTISVDIKNINIDQKVDFELPTQLLKSRLAKMDTKSPFNIEYNQGLENIIKSFLKSRKKSFERLMAISEFYFPMFEEAMARQNVPLEIKYLAVVESALNPKAVSRVGATGLWQFMFQTGKQYGLNINTYVDDRSDPLKASDAAALYMSNMYKIFGDWDLVLASYNSGPGNVAKAIRRSGGQQNFWNIRKYLPKETQGYVPAFLATMYIYEYHKEHGIVPNRAAIKHFATDTIMIKREITFKQISDLIDIPLSQLQLLNPSYKRDVVPFIEGENHFLRLPNDKVAIYTSNEDKIYAYTQYEASKRERPYESRGIAVRDTLNTDSEITVVSKTRYYKVKLGDSLIEIAGKFGVAMSDIKKWNKLKNNKAPKGRNLKIYSYESVPLTSKKQEIKVTESKKDSAIVAINTYVSEKKYWEEQVVSFVKRTKKYKVRKGDNLGSIAAKYNVSVSDIKYWNSLKKNTISSGKILKIMTTERVVSKVRKEIKADKKLVETKDLLASTDAKSDKNLTTEISKTTEYYVVQKGDNLGNIAKKYAVTIEDLKQWNNLSDINVQLGTQLKIANESGNTEEQVAVKKEYKIQDYVVLKGDNVGTIAKKYKVSQEDIKLWNNLADNNIQFGSTIIVSKTEIVIPEKATNKEKTASKSTKNQEHYYVQKGDSLYKIAKKFPGITILDIKKWNGISNENLKPGMKLKING